MKKRVAIVAGGDQSELEVSLRSAAGLYSFIDANKYECHIVTIVGTEWNVDYEGKKYVIDKNDFSFVIESGKRLNFDFAYITIHGVPGEDGKLQGYFDLIRMPYSCCGVLSAALTFNKFFLEGKLWLIYQKQNGSSSKRKPLNSVNSAFKQQFGQVADISAAV